MIITVDPSGLRVQIRALPITINPRSSDQFNVCVFLFILLENNCGTHTECLNIHVFSLKKREMDLIDNRLIGPK